MKISTLSKLASALLIAGCVAMLATTSVALQTLKVGGDIYARIVLGKDLVADILPPPEYIIESYLEATLALNDPKTVEARRERLAVLRKDYDSRHEYWTQQELEAAIREPLTVGAHGHALRFWELTEGTFLPALANGDLEMARSAYAQMAEAYAAHRSNIDTAVSGANQFIAATENDATAQEQLMMLAVWIVSGLMLALAVACAVGVSMGLVTPVVRMTSAMRELAEGNFDIVLPGLGRKDEIGDIATAVEGFKVKAAEKAQRDAEHQQGARRAAEAQRRAEMLKLADRFQAAVGDIIETVSSASTQLETSARVLTKTAESTQQLSGMVTSASTEMSQNVQSVATAAEELTGTVKEISRQVHDSSAVAGQAVTQTQKVDARMAELAQAAGRIGDVIQLITGVASQTNLLALNATIEAARAGEAGKGFAVVAQEVKALATQTSKATAEIESQIAGMQTATHDAVEAIKEVSATIARLSEIATTISAAVEEQGAATQEIATHVQQAAAGTTEVAANITDVSKGAAATGSAATQVYGSATSLSGESKRLKEEVERFLATVRAA